MSTKKKTPKKTNARQLPDWEDGIQIGSLPKMLKNESPFSYGDEVMCLKEIDCLHKVQKCCGYRNSKIPKRKTFSDGDVVREIDHIEIVRKLQTDHGNWKEIPGQIGKVMQVHKDGDFPGQFQDKSSICNPAYLASCRSNQDENFMTPDTSTESKSLGKPAESPTEKSVRRTLFQPEDDCGNSTVEMASQEESPDTASTGEWHTDSSELLEKPVVEEKTSPVSKTKNNRLLEEFEDIKEIGSGGCGIVYKATHRLDRKVYAIKCVSDDKEGKREVRAMVKLKHKNIVRYYTCWIGKYTYELEDSSNNSSVDEVYAHDHWFIQMEFCEKGTLEFWIDQKNDIEIHEDDVSLKFQQIIEGVAYIHSQDIIHRDLKPSNIFISSQDIIKIGDFGLAASGVDDLSVKRTDSTGTTTYMAPEQIETTYGKEVDIFPLGLIWFEMLYRFRSRHERSQKWKDIRGCKFPPEFVKQFPAEASIIKQLLSKETSKRMHIDVLLEFLNRNESNQQESLAKSVKNQSEAWTGRPLLS